MDILNKKVTSCLPSECSDSEADNLLRIAMDIGEGLLKNGAEIHRVELAIETICHAYGAAHVEVFSIQSLILASVRMKDHTYSSQTRRILDISNNLHMLEAYNSLSRKICQERPDFDAVDEMLRAVKEKKRYPRFLLMLGYMLASGSFAVFFGGSVRDGIAGALVGILVFLLDLVHFDFFNKMAKTLLTAFVAGIGAYLSIFAGIGQNVDMIIIGSIMLLIPGLALGNAMRDLFCGDILAGVLKLIQACVTTVMIAIGYGLAILLLGGIA